MSLYLKYRPDDFGGIFGNVSLLSVLGGMVEENKVPHSILLTGPTGCGKTTIARILAEKIGAIGSDIREIDSADFRGIDTIREMRKQTQFRPMESDSRVWIIDECHKLTNDAQNALLKILEDTPAHVYFVLCTTDPQKLLPTVKGRCSTFQVSLLNDIEMMRLLRFVTKSEGETVQKIVYESIIRDSLGHPRNALQILEQVLSVGQDARLETAQKSAEEQSQSIELCRALIGRASWKKVAGILNGLKDQDAEGIRRHILGYCQAILLKESNDQAALIIEELYEPLYNVGFPGLVYSCYSILK